MEDSRSRRPPRPPVSRRPRTSSAARGAFPGRSVKHAWTGGRPPCDRDSGRDVDRPWQAPCPGRPGRESPGGIAGRPEPPLHPSGAGFALPPERQGPSVTGPGRPRHFFDGGFRGPACLPDLLPWPEGAAESSQARDGRRGRSRPRRRQARLKDRVAWTMMISRAPFQCRRSSSSSESSQSSSCQSHEGTYGCLPTRCSSLAWT